MVVLDAAHGGDDAGGQLDTPRGEDLHAGLQRAAAFAAGARGIQVVTTRESDATVDLDRRAEIANHANAQACLSLHASESGSGVHLFISSLAPGAARRALPPGRPRRPPGYRAAWRWPGCSTSALLHAGMTVTLGRTALPAVDSMTCPAVAVEIAPEARRRTRQPTARWTTPTIRRA